jgi:hypothetical protein
MSEIVVDEKDSLIRAMQNDLDRLLPEEIRETTPEFIGTRQAMTAVLAESVQTQRLYFVVRSVLMSLISAVVYFTVVLYLGTINAIHLRGLCIHCCAYRI